MLKRELRGLRASVLAITLICLGFPASAFQFGACIHLALGRSDATSVTRILSDLGMTTIRDDVYWSRIERKPGELAFPDKFAELDRAVRQVRRAGGRPLLILSFGNPNYDNGSLITSDEGIAAFERYVRFVVRHFGNAVDQYEVWNEWNTGFGSNPRVKYGDPDQYVRLLSRTFNAIREENSKAVVIGGSTAGIDMRWTEAFIKAGGLKYLDAFSVHSYTTFQYRLNPEVAIRGLDELHEMIRAADPRTTIPIYITEMGWPTNTGARGLSEATVADYLIRFMLLARTRPWIEGVWWYDLIDDGDDPTKMEHRFGLVRSDLRPKPASLAAQRVARLLSSPTPPSSFRLSDGSYAVRGHDSSGDWMVVWRVEARSADWPRGFSSERKASVDLDREADHSKPDGKPILLRRSGDAWKADTHGFY